MPRASGIKQLLSPSKGLVTEQSKLTPIEGSTVSELNFTFNDDGSVRQRRLGINKEVGSSFFSLTEDVTDTNATAYTKWDSVNGDGDLNLHVFQIGATLFFFEDGATSVAAGIKQFTFDLDTMVAPAFSTVETAPVSMAGGEGKLFVVGREITPFYLAYDPDTSTVSGTVVGLSIRDLTGIDDSLEVDERPATNAQEHDYNLNNQGWAQTRRIVAAGSFVDPIAQFNTTNSAYPSNADIALLGVVDDGDGNLIYDADYLLDLTLGNTPAPKGHFVINPFYIDYEGLRNGTVDASGGYWAANGGAVTAGTSETFSDTVDPIWWKEPLDPEWLP